MFQRVNGVLWLDSEAAGNDRNGVGSLYQESLKNALRFYTVDQVMFRVRVNKIESIRDLDGNLGKRIELLEEREIPRFAVRPQTEEAQVVQDVLQALQQQMPMFQPRTQLAIPKIILFLTEQEYESMGIEFDVNQIYDTNLENQSIRFMKTG